MNAMNWANANLRALGDFDAFVRGDRVWRADVVRDHSARVAAGLAAMGVAPGDRVMLWLPNGPELVISSRAVLSAGAVTVLAHYDAPLRRIEELAAETAPTAIVTSAARVPPDTDLPTVRFRVQADLAQQQPGWYGLGTMLTEHEPLAEAIPRSGRDLAAIVYTSGTTGPPKGIVTRHGALTNSLIRRRRRFGRWRQSARHLAVLPMSSPFGNRALFDGLARKCTLYFLERFEPQRVLEAIENHQIQETAFVPTMCQALLAVANAGDYDLSSLTSVVCGGSNVSPDLVDRFMKVFGIRIRIAYGMSGIGPVSRTGSSAKRGSVGRLAPGLKARLVDADGRDIPPGEFGELELRPSDDSAVEIWNADASVTSVLNSEGWFRTGDLVRFDPDGEMFILGRGDDLIIQGGHNINTRAVSELIERLSGVRECAVVGVPSDYLDQEAVACVALREGARLTSRDIIGYCRENLEMRAAPASVWFVDALPRNESGKVIGRELRTAISVARGLVYETDLSRRLANTPEESRFGLLQTELRRRLEKVLYGANCHAVSARTSFRDIGLDSLGAVELTHALSEAIGRPLPLTLTYTHPTVDALCAHLLELLGFGSIAAGASPDRLPPTGAHTIRLDQFIPPVDIAVAVQSAQAPDIAQRSKVVLLTGANGFLGRFLAIEILKQLADSGSKLYCLVRSNSPASALERLRTAYDSDPGLLAIFEGLLSEGRLIVLCGNLTQSRFGLSEVAYANLCDEVDCIVHNAAVVDHALGYRELFSPNVLGTVEVIRLAIARRMKSINYVSTIAVRNVAGKSMPTEYTGKAVGYSLSKWAGEQLLRDLHRQTGIPVRIYRPSQIMAHRQYQGQINARDEFSRLLSGIVSTSLAPQSFYAVKKRERGGHYDGLPVDVVARSIAALSIAGSDGGPACVDYAMVNPHCNVDLDTIVDWVGSAGYSVERMEDYASWYLAFCNSLGTLDRSKRKLSLLPLIHAWERPITRPAARFDKPTLSADVAHLAGGGAADPLADIPCISEAFVHKCLADLCALGLIGPAR